MTAAFTEDAAAATMARLATLPEADEDGSAARIEALRGLVLEHGWQPGLPPRAEERGWRERPEGVLAHLPGQPWADQWILLSGGLSSGDTSPAALLEVTRALGDLASRGWQPRRTLVVLAPTVPGPRHPARSWTGARERLPRPLHALIEGEASAGRGTLIGLASPPLLTWAQDIVGHLGGAGARAEILASWAPISGDAGRGGELLGSGIPILRLGMVPGSCVDCSVEAGAVETALVASAMAIAALRLADATLPPHDQATGAVHALDGLIELSDRAAAAYDGNPPPTTTARIALGQLRVEAEAWQGAAAGWLARIRRADPLEGAEAAQRATRAGTLLLAAGSPFHDYVEDEPSPGCRNLLLCAVPGSGGGELVPLPGMERALASGDRAALAAETLRLAAAASLAAARIAEARHALTGPPPPEAPGGN